MKSKALLILGLMIAGAGVSDPGIAEPYPYRDRPGHQRSYQGYPYFPLSSGVVFPVPNSYNARRPRLLGEPLSDSRRARGGRAGECRYIVAEGYNSKGVSRSLCPRR